MLKNNRLISSVILASWIALLAVRIAMPKPAEDARGVEVWIEIAWLLLVYLFILFAGLGLGRMVVRYLKIESLARLESVILELLLGLGTLSFGVMVLGFAGILNQWAILFWMVVSGAISLREMIGSGFPQFAPTTTRTKDPYLILLQLVTAAAMLLLVMECLTPVWDYDAQLYHLEGPRQFLAQGQFTFDSEVLRSAYPYLGEMLFTVGLAFDLPSLAKLVNFSFAILFFLSCYAFSRRFFGVQTAGTGIGILIGAPAFWIWATWASVDFAWAAFEFWSVYAIMLWLEGEKEDTFKWMRLAGIMSGLAIGVKYLSLPTLLIVGLIILWKSVENRHQPVKHAAMNIFEFSGFAALAGSAWYLRNWASTGNPVYPLVFGGPVWEPLEAQILADYVGSFGVGKTWLDYLLLPYNVYAHHDHFSTIGIEWIHPALWLALVFPFFLKPVRRFDVLIVYACLGFGVWAVSSQVIRFLMPLSAILAILSGAVIESMRPIVKAVLKFGLIGGFMLYNLIFQLQWLQDRDTLHYLTGRHSIAGYLQNMSYGYETIHFIQDSLDADEKVQFLWDGRGYYCDTRCVADDEQSGAVILAFEDPPPSALAADLNRKGITHLMLSEPDVTWFMLYHDPQRMHRNAYHYYTEVFFPTCGKLIHEEAGMSLYEITCP